MIKAELHDNIVRVFDGQTMARYNFAMFSETKFIIWDINGIEVLSKTSSLLTVDDWNTFKRKIFDHFSFTVNDEYCPDFIFHKLKLNNFTVEEMIEKLSRMDRKLKVVFTNGSHKTDVMTFSTESVNIDKVSYPPHTLHVNLHFLKR
jgi:hypothetical protein